MESIITLLTDFGWEDGYVGTMKGVILKINPNVQLIDITHQIHPHDIREAAFTLLTSYSYFPPGTIHLAVVDPGVGSLRKPIIVSTKDYYFVGPDNGLFTFLDEKREIQKVIEFRNRKYCLSQLSDTFHGRDIFAPVAAHLSRGTKIEDFGEEIKDWVKLPFPKQNWEEKRIKGEILHIDKFGNLITNIPEGSLPKRGFLLEIKGRKINKISHSYSQGEEGELLLISGSSGFFEISTNRGRASDLLGVKRGEELIVLFPNLRRNHAR